MPRYEPPRITATRLHDLPNGQVFASAIDTGVDQWHRYALAYKRSGDVLAEIISKNDIQRNFLAVPALFLYRHYVELHLKSLLLDAGELLDDPQVVPPQHYLLTLWRRVRVLLLKVDPGDSPWLQRADDVITEFDALDPTSFAFRYPVDNSRNPSLPPGLTVEIPSISSVIAELHILLEGASTQIDVYMGYKNELP